MTGQAEFDKYNADSRVGCPYKTVPLFSEAVTKSREIRLLFFYLTSEQMFCIINSYKR